MNTLLQSITSEISILVYEMEVSPSTSFAVMAMSMITCFILNALIDKLPVPSKYAERSRRHKWRNVLVSTVHAVSGTIGGFASIYLTPELLSDHLNALSSTMLISMAISNGYYVYDFCDLARNTKLAEFLPLMIHHTMGMGFVCWVLIERKLIGIIAISSCMELNGIFLHLRHILLMCSYKKSDIVFQINNVFNVVTYFVLRLGIFTYVTWWLCGHWTEVGLLLPPMAAILLILNILLFYRLIKSDYFGRSQKSEESDIMSGDE
ncbi:TLC domain-containing protein 2-like [Strongylocentrotus purpuratus]|uniref:TLC domain-containing protein n=1 Tax=Strongylocentrotus purpuratus TaxID=7668 RepID=A0A7M7HCF1_STRPU|nr:TLC domain-containing protein 2-like [Strongylocentrotus purpuratus]